MKKLIFPLLFCIALFSACSSPNRLQPTLSVQFSPSPPMTKTSIPEPTFIPTDTAVLPSPTPTETITPSPTFPPAGIFAIKFYPPLVLDYPANQWVDKSEYNNTEMMVNYLQNQDLKTCTIGTMGPSEFYPDSMKDVTLGNIGYQVLLDQNTTSGDTISYYFAISTSTGSIENDVGIAIFDVQSTPAEAKKCRVAAEDVLATLHRSD